jgi:hypothetical protein
MSGMKKSWFLDEKGDLKAVIEDKELYFKDNTGIEL